jgi:hypothetical protein
VEDRPKRPYLHHQNRPQATWRFKRVCHCADSTSSVEACGIPPSGSQETIFSGNYAIIRETLLISFLIP